MVTINAQENDPDKTLKEVFSIEEIESKTELTSKQIENVNKVLLMSQIFRSSLIYKTVNNFMILQKSKDRASMKEFVEGMRSKRDDYINQGKGFVNNMFG